MDTLKAASTLITLVVVDKEHHRRAANYHPRSLPEECYLRNHTIGSQYKNHVFDILKVSDVKMPKRNVLMESVSFYECLLLVKEQRDNPDEAF
jgi:hypothetical protein